MKKNVKKSAQKIVVFNAGSSSLKFEIFEVRPGARGVLKSIHQGIFDNHGKPIKNFQKLVGQVLAKFKNDEIVAIGHRVVHGGERYTKATLITPKVTATIKKLSDLAPLHNPPNLACILACKKLLPRTPQVAVFDTAFHQTMSEKAYLYALPYSFYKKFGIRRYGFHGTSHQYVFEVARKKLGVRATQRTVTCHLGNGCSLAAILNGRVVDTSMGFTPLEGIPMGTRSGDIDPAIIFYLMERGFSAREVEKILNKKSGLLGMSGISSDMRELWKAYTKGSGAKRAAVRRTLDLFCYRIAKYIGAYTVALGGLDCVVFTGGTGEHAGYIRKWVMAQVKKIAQPRVLAIKTDEEKKIAEATQKIFKI